MAKDKVHTVKEWLKLIGYASVAAAAITTALTFFAKAKTVDKLDARLGLSISQDIVNNEESNLRWMRQQTVFERKNQPPSPAEAEMIKDAETKLVERKEIHKERIKGYEEKYKQAF